MMVEEKNHVVYQILRPFETGDYRYYIGVSSYSEAYTPKTRWQQHKISKHWVGRFIRKYNDSFMEIIYTNLTKLEAYNIESKLVPPSPQDRKILCLLNERRGGDVPPNHRDSSPEKLAELSVKISKGLEQYYNNNMAARLKRKQEMLDYHKLNPLARKIVQKKRFDYFNDISKRRPFHLISPENEHITHNEITLGQLAVKYNLAATNLSRLVLGKMKYYKGWRTLENIDQKRTKHAKRFVLKSPEGEIFKGENVSAFCKEHGLNDASYILKMIKGIARYKSYKGWTVVKEDDSNIQ